MPRSAAPKKLLAALAPAQADLRAGSPSNNP